MVIERMELHHFRNYDNLILNPHEGINIFFGQNGSGKTNLLEAIHYCSLGKSHRISQDINAVMMDEPGASCRMMIRSSFGRKEVEVRLRPGDDSIKSVWIDQKKAARLSEMMGVLRCVMFSPEDLELIRGGPQVRRRFLDMMISQISRTYFIALQQYRIALNQRNAILRQARAENRNPDPMISDFEAAMSEHAEVICREREKYIRMIAENGKRIYCQISGKTQEEFHISYRGSMKWNQSDLFPMKSLLEECREEDLRQGSTSVGPQRDDLLLSMNQKSMKLYASQGQMRTGALSLKLSQLQIFQQMTGEKPVLLLDDVMSELDLDRRMNILKMIDGVQTFITCSDEGDLAEYQNHRTCQVFTRNGKAELLQKKEGPQTGQKILKEPVFD